MSERVELWAAFLRVLALGVLLVGIGLRSVGDTYAPFSDTATVSGSVTAAASFVPIAASVDIDPDVLRPGSQGQFVTAYIELPAGFDVANIDVSTVALRAEGEAGSVPALPHPTKVGDHDHDGIADLMSGVRPPGGAGAAEREERRCDHRGLGSALRRPGLPGERHHPPAPRRKGRGRDGRDRNANAHRYPDRGADCHRDPHADLGAPASHGRAEARPTGRPPPPAR